VDKFRVLAQSPKSTGSLSPLLLPPHCQSIGVAAVKVTLEHLCPQEIFDMILEDYLELIYPITPIVHRPSFRQLVVDRQYETDPALLRLCLSLCAMTISSMHRKIEIYGFGFYASPREMVNRAYQLVMASRLVTVPQWANEPSIDTLLCSLLLGMASHYTESPSQGWVLLNESMHCSRSLGLFQKEAYESRNVINTEICKRAFWMLYIIQM